MASPVLQNLLAWGRSEGIKIDGIAPMPVRGKGLGMVATRNLAKDDVVLAVPIGLARTVESTPAWILERLQESSCQAVLAVSLCLERSPSFEHWRRMLPTKHEIDGSHPIRWPRELVHCLPQSARRTLHEQEKKFWDDWQSVKGKFADVERDDFQYAWILVNTHVFHHSPNLKRDGQTDRVALVPIADLFNHHPEGGCSARQEGNQYIVRAAQTYRKGDELHISYGKRSNDYLLVEYGFLLSDEENAFEETCLDEPLCPRFTPSQGAIFQRRHVWCHFDFNSDGLSPRAVLAIRALTLSEIDWDELLNGTLVFTEDDQKVANGLLHEVLKLWGEEIVDIVRKIDEMYVGQDYSRALVRGRWCQVRRLVQSTRGNLHRPSWV